MRKRGEKKREQEEEVTSNSQLFWGVYGTPGDSDTPFHPS